MTIRTFALAEEDLFATVRVTGQNARLLRALEQAQITYYGANLLIPERVKRRHSSSRDPIRNDVGELSVAEILNLGTSRDVRALFASAAIQSVASCTQRGKDALTGGSLAGDGLGCGRLLSAEGGDTHGCR